MKNKIKKQFAVIGLGRFGRSVAKSLFEMGYEVMGIDGKESIIQESISFVTHAVQADSTDEQALKELGIRNFDTVVVAIGEDIQASILTTLILKQMEVPIVVVKAQNDLHGKVLYKIGADKVVFPERDMGLRVAHHLISPNIIDMIELSDNYSIVEVTAGKSMVGKSLKELQVRAVFGCSVMAIKTGEHINIAPLAEDTIHQNDVLVVIGKNADLQRFEESI